MTREEAIKIIEDFGKAGGNIFIDGCKGKMPDSDLISLAKNCQILMEMNKPEIEKLIDKAAEFIGTDESLRSITCIDVALDHAFNLRDELRDLYREKQDLQIGKYRLSPYKVNSIRIYKDDGEGGEFSVEELERRIDALWKEEF